ncbi:sulfotransferase family protein [Desulfonema magnum]|uniref:Sulfotransferase domain-containing protein n=1 Tax=Desulfonema magnum TaxID=45655 RepID=A0A975BV27_9BACT|nr:sulfotransferase domain-containing protein [Desulfonema magnum]QTA91882.1 Sulfotransferase domain-containing protein [Desulfonema magnum]
MKMSNPKSSNFFQNKISRKIFRLFKEIYHCFKFRQNHQKKILFIIGCQRSGTTLVTERIFDKDLSVKVYKEVSKLSRNSISGIRLNSLNTVKSMLEKDKAPVIVLKPLVETQNSLNLLDYFPNSGALWMYRNYKDVAASNLRRFGLKNGINNLRPVIEKEPHNWRSEHVSEEVRKIVIRYFAEDMNPYDAAALFWFVRNHFFFELKLDQHPRVMMCRYENFVANPLENMQQIYKFLGHDFPGAQILTEVHPSSVGKGKTIKLSPDIELLCEELLEKLNHAWELRIEN